MTKNRAPRFAGKFYPQSASLLQEELDTLFLDAAGRTSDKIPRAIISPHAGYVFSGQVAASAFSQIPQNTLFKRVFVLASSHRYSFSGAAVYGQGNYMTPLGELKTDTELETRLVSSHEVFRYYPEAHNHEHSLEVQLPFLQHWLGKDFLLVPVILGTDNPNDCKKIAEALKPWFTPENLFIISTDFSHYPGYEDAVKIDLHTADAICSNNPEKLLHVIKENKKRKIPQLATSLCGWTSVLTLLYLTQNRNIHFKKTEYRNSGDSMPYGDREEVVGYWALAAYETGMPSPISPEKQKELLKMGHNALEQYLKTGKSVISQSPESDEIYVPHTGVFVSTYVKGELRGCIGSFEENEMLSAQVQHLAVSAAQDSRFKKPEIDDLDETELEISILSPFQKIRSVEEIEPGKHGIYIKKDLNSGIFLPHVAERNEWSREEFLGRCSRDKAGLGWDGWKEAELYVFEAFVFRG